VKYQAHFSTSDSANMKTRRAFITIATAVSLALVACSTEYSTYYGSPVVVGQGGASRQIGGIDFWTVGAPPRPYQVIGYIEDSRPGGPPAMAGRLGAVAAKARAAGADGIIITSDNKEYMGTYSTASINGWNNGYNFGASGIGTTVNITRRNSTFLAIKYVNNVPLAPKVKG
jgi:hypothetical protein